MKIIQIGNTFADLSSISRKVAKLGPHEFFSDHFPARNKFFPKALKIAEEVMKRSLPEERSLIEEIAKNFKRNGSKSSSTSPSSPLESTVPVAQEEVIQKKMPDDSMPLFPQVDMDTNGNSEPVEAPLREQRTTSGSLMGMSLVLIKTKRKLLANGDVTTPDGWEEQEKYEARWDQEPFEEEVGTEDYNNGVSDLEDIAWLLSGINHVKLAIYQSKVLELLMLSWKPCWVPLHLVAFKSDKLKVQLKTLKVKYTRSSKDAKLNLKKDIPTHVKRAMALYRLSDNTKFLVKQFVKFAAIDMPQRKTPLEVVKADFCHTYEHCSALLRSEEGYENLFKRRIEAGKALMKKVTDASETELLQKFILRSETELQKLLKT